MAFVRTKKVDGREYHQLVQSYREDGKPRQRVLAHLGEFSSVDEALEGLPAKIDLGRRITHLWPPKLVPGHERRLGAMQARLDILRRLRADGVA